MRVDTGRLVAFESGTRRLIAEGSNTGETDIPLCINFPLEFSGSCIGADCPVIVQISFLSTEKRNGNNQKKVQKKYGNRKAINTE
jgi:hypothetical protein